MAFSHTENRTPVFDVASASSSSVALWLYRSCALSTGMVTRAAKTERDAAPKESAT